MSPCVILYLISFPLIIHFQTYKYIEATLKRLSHFLLFSLYSVTPPPLPEPRDKRNKGLFMRLEGRRSPLMLLITMGDWEMKTKKKNHAFSMRLVFWFRVVFTQHVVFLPFALLWFSLISYTIKGLRRVSLISVSRSKHCLPPRTTAALLLHFCQNS